MSVIYKTYNDYRDLFKNRSEPLKSSDFLLFTDRSIGPGAEQILMDRLSNPETAQYAWPCSRVFTVHRLAKALTKPGLQKISSEALRELSKIEILDQWLSLWPNEPLSALTNSWQRADKLLAHSTNAQTWKNIFDDVQNETDPELKDWSKDLLTTLYLCLTCDQQGLLGTRWHLLQKVSDFLDQVHREHWIQALEIHPWHCQKKINFHVPLLKSALPLEHVFLKKLEQNPSCNVIYYKAPDVDATSPLFENLEPLKTSQDPEFLVMMEGLRSLPLTLLESFCTFSQKLNLTSLPESPQRRDLSNDPNHESFDELNVILQKHNLKETLATKDRLAALHFLGKLETNVAQDESHAALSSRGLSVLSFDDLWSLPFECVAVISNKKDFDDYFDPLSKYNSSKETLPAPLRHLLSHHHVSFSREFDEIQAAKQFFHAQKNKIFLKELNSPPRRTFVTERTPDSHLASATEVPHKKIFSPSSIEDLLKCPFRYHSLRVEKAHDLPEHDALSLNPLRRGQWYHKAFENFFRAPNFESSPLEQITTSLTTNIDETFSRIVSPDYLKSLKLKIPKVAQDLCEHILQFEFPLNQIFQTRTFDLETPVRADIHGLSLYGKIDRVDHVGDNQILIWDYKSGGQYGFATKTLLSPTKRKIQWHLYKAMIETSTPYRVVGGGYLQIQNPIDSGIYFYEEHLSPEILSQILQEFESSEYNVKWISSEQDKVNHECLMENLDTAKNVIQNGIYPKNPLKESDCKTCPASAKCGRPYFLSGTLSEDLS